MARRKPHPESFRNKLDLAARLAALRTELFGQQGGSEMAKRLGILSQTWDNYEQGITVPGEIILKLIEVTSVEPRWLSDGQGPRFRQFRNEPVATVASEPVRPRAGFAYWSCN
jgi:hypothetical protein